MLNEFQQMEAYAYRVSARFGSRVQVSVSNGQFTITGPRVVLAMYRTWIAVQAVLLVVALPTWHWAYLVAAVGALLAHRAVGGFGAGCLWEMASLRAFIEGARGDTVSFPVSEVRDVRIGTGWAWRGMWLLPLPWYAGISALAAGVAVSFIAPDGTAGGGVYALHLQTPEDAQAPAQWLSGGTGENLGSD